MRSARPYCLGVALLTSLASASGTHAAEGRYDGPDVTIISGETRTVYEYRHNGELRMVRVVPKRGKPYYLVPRDGTQGFGNLERAETLLPSWVIVQF